MAKLSGQNAGHYVPQSDLKRFADENDRVYALTQLRIKKENAQVRNLAVEKNYYKTPDSYEKRVASKKFQQSSR